MSGRPISYAQRYEDLYLMRCFGARSEGFYIDIGSGHPVYDNMSFAFYLQGWRGITVEPNPWLARLSRAVRPRDCHLEALIGAASGEATFYLVEELHGLSTMIESYANAARTRFGKRSQAMQAPITTLRELCAQHAPAAFDFLKVDVEGAERDVIRNGDWQNHRPKVVIVEALAPFTLAPAWEAWEPILTGHCYRYACFDSLNRYYVAEEASELAARLENAPSSFGGALQFRDADPALADMSHPDHGLAMLLRGADMTGLPLLERGQLCKLLTAGISAAALEKTADPGEISAAVRRLFGPDATLTAGDLQLPSAPRLRDVYAAIVESDQFRTACGRISASYAW